ncbi:MAG: hypothetical protein HY063_04145 [Bacteroidetes bacterium]|nr:hypothetical protein [Bacteroidota bacterium]
MSRLLLLAFITLIVIEGFSPALCTAQEKISFTKQNNASEKVLLKLPLHCTLQTYDSIAHIGVLYRIAHDSLLCFREQRKLWNAGSGEEMNFWDSMRAIYADTSLTDDEKRKQMNALIYPDSFSVAFRSIQQLKFPVSNVKKHSEKVIKGIAIAAGLFLLGSHLIQMDFEKLEREDDAVNHPTAYKSVAGLGLMVASFTVFSNSFHYTITPDKWKLMTND